MLNKKKLALRGSAMSILLLVMSACSDSTDPPPAEIPTAKALFNSLATPAVLPFPNAIYATPNGRLGLPLAPDTVAGDLGDPVVALNTLDGFSTIAPIHASFAEAINATTIVGGGNVRLFEVAVDDRNLPTSIISELEAGRDYKVTLSAVLDSRVLVKPLIPLNASSNYLVGIGTGILAQSGLELGPSADYVDLRDGQQSSEAGSVDRSFLSELIGAQESLLSDSGMTEDGIVLSFSFPTHSTTDVLSAINGIATAMDVSLIRPTMTVNGEVMPLTSIPFAGLAAVFGMTPSGQADIYTGVIDLPYYMNVPTNPADDTVLDSYLRNAVGEPILDPGAGLQSVNLTVPLLMAIPNSSLDSSLVRPLSGWPVAIYQHGITGNRSNMLLIADALAARGVAMVAIDQPVHGVTPNDAGFLPLSLYTAFGVNFYDMENERHFNLDLNDDGIVDPAGQYSGSPRNALTFRDNLRQAVSDLVYLSRTLPTISLPDVPGLAFNADEVHFVSLSLGSMVGTMLAGVNSDIKAFSLSAPGGGITKFTEGSPNSNAGVLANAAELGLTQGNPDYEDYLRLLTTISGPGDPINYAVAAAQGHPIHITEIVGDGTPENPPDQTIPNDVLNAGQYEGLVVETAPLAGTEPLVRSMNLEALLDDAMNPEGLRVVARFVRGDHQSQVNPSNALSPFALPEVTQEIQNQTATFIASGGTTIEVLDSSLLEMNFVPVDP
ncbi:MAG: pimeloyl-ACP methyl ester carboxylesterase [Halieaceae bacterium]|jgi:pimeloyl-ACP methyl ester carboxylesterase